MHRRSPDRQPSTGAAKLNITGMAMNAYLNASFMVATFAFTLGYSSLWVPPVIAVDADMGTEIVVH